MSPTLRQAIVALRAGRAKEAESLASAVLARGEENSLAAKILGQALMLQGRAEAATRPLEQAARGDNDPELRILLGRALGDAGREAEALDVLNQVAGHSPLIPQSFLALADQLWKMGRAGDAVARLEEGLSLAPDETLLKIGLGYLHLRRHDHVSARALFAEIHATTPDQYDGLVGLAIASALNGAFAEAAELYRHALALRPGDLTARINLAKCLLEIGEREAGDRVICEAARTARQAAPFVTALADTAHGRFFLRPSAARQFLRGNPD